jgi:uncharacterized protein YecE (DUF72 family)
MGFGYADWRQVFYPEGLKPGDYLSFYARHFDCVEIDSSFHAAPEPARFVKWAQAVPEAFRFCVKTPRAITHESVVADALPPMRAFLESAAKLEEKLAVVLIQYPPTLPGRVWPQVHRFLGQLPDAFRYAVEFRNASWCRDEVYRGLESLNVSLVSAEYEVEPSPPIITSDFAYLRLIGLHGRYEPMTHERVDTTQRLIWWRDQITAQAARTAWVMMNNDYAGFSIATGDRFKALVGQPVSSHQERLGMLF